MIERNIGNKNSVVWSCLLLLLLLCNATVKAQTPVASFTSDVQTGCAPLFVNFTNTSINANSYSWTLGNGSNASTANPSAIYLNPGSYTVTLTATNTVNGQQSSTTQTITVVNNPVADFTVATTTGCEEANNICFTNTSQFAATYTWDFGDGNTSVSVNPCHNYANAGIYTVKLVAVSTYGCSDLESKSNIITINPKPSANFTSNIQSTCNLTDAFNFTSTTSGAVSWNWNFGDFSTSTQQNPSHTYAASGTYSVSLIATNSFGCKDTNNKINYINIGASLVPSFTMSDTGGCAPFSVNFNCIVANATSWSWNLGNGYTSTVQNPSTTYTLPGNYTITLSVTTQSGCNGSVTIPGLVVVDPLPVPSFTVTQDTGCSPFTPQINNTSTGASTYAWSTNPLLQQSTATNPTFTYVNAGPYNISLTAYSPNGCPQSTTVNNAIRVLDPSAAFTGTPLTGCPGMTANFTFSGTAGIATYYWNFGDGTTSALQNPSHTYSALGNYNVYLIVTNSFGCKDTVYRPNYIKIYPGAIPYTTDTMKVCQGIVQAFNDPTQGSNSWNWNFGDGATSTTRNPTHIYSIPGTYTVTLNTTMAGGCSQSFNSFHIVQVIPYTPKPVVITYISRCKPYSISFSNAAATVTAYLWDFGDGTTSAVPAPVHNYTTAGTYTVKLYLTVGSGCQDLITNTITVGNVNPMRVDTMTVCIGTPNQFTLLNPTAFVSYKWDFGDLTSSTQKNPAHIYSTGGNFTVTLMTTDTSGCKDTFQLGPIVVNNPLASFSVIGPTLGCTSLTVQFQNNSTGATSYAWDFGDGKTSTLANPSHTFYNYSLNYTVTLTATINGCSNTQVQTNLITIITPQCNFSYATNDLCLPISVNYTDLSPGAVSWLWDFGDGNTSTQQNPVHNFLTAPSGPVTLTIADQYGCTATLSKTNITYYSASALINVTSGCTPLTASFTDQSNSATAWSWHFGDGGTSTLANPTHTYNSDGIYDITLIVTFPGGCRDTVIYPAAVTASTPIADFVAPAASGCSPVNISFTNLSTDAVSFIWDFGDGSTSSNINPTHIYNIPGYYNVKLVATSGMGCNDTMVKNAYIAVPGVYSSFSISSAVGCDTLPAFFNDSSINAVNWSWNFGDGFTSSLPDPTHTYQDTGSYVVTLVTHDTLGCTSIYTYPIPIQIYLSPTASATTADVMGCNDYAVSFTNQSVNANSYSWDFGNGATSTATNPNYIYTQPGIFYPTVIAITIAGCRDTFALPAITVLETPIAQFSSSADTACEPATISFSNQSSALSSPAYSWTFGNGQSSNAQNPTALYTANSYNISLIVSNSNGCADTATSPVVINPTPVASASTADIEGCQPYHVQFSNSTTGATQYSWLFETGSGSNVAVPNHIYNSPGIYYPSLIATNNFGCADTFNFNSPVTVHAVPVTSFTPSAVTVCNPDSITFTNNSTNLENPVYTWDYGNGITNSLTTGGVMYTDSGLYNVKLIVVNTFGCSDSASSNITVNPSPVATASTNDTAGCSPYLVTFTNTSQNATSYIWDFGDSMNSSTAQPSHSYLTGGNYQPILIATNNYGCVDTLVLPTLINVKQSPSAAFIASDTAICYGLPITFNNNSTNLLTPSYAWNFGFTNVNSNNPVIIYPGPGFYDVSLTVTNNNGCTDSISKLSYIEIFDTLPPNPSNLLSVSVVDDNSVDVLWENNSATDLGAYIVYRLDPLTGLYNLVYSDNSPKSFAVTPTSTYRDTGLDTRNNTYSYKIVTADRCGYVLPISNSVAHTTMNVTAVQSGTNIDLSWTPYLGCNISSYDITRTEVASGAVQVITNIPSNILNYLDTTLTCPFEYSYRITAKDLCGNVYISYSDTSDAVPMNILAGQHVDVVRSTVLNNIQILTEWIPPVLLPNRVQSYEVLRSTDNITFTPLAIVPSVVTSYIDNAVKINERNYYYRIAVINDCNLSGPEGTEGSSILLQGEWQNYRTKLHWTKYDFWNNGVDHYTIQKLNEFGVWEDYWDVDGNTTDVDLNE